MSAHFNGFVFLFNINCKLINKIHAALSHADILSIKIFGMRIKLFELEFIKIKGADRK